MRSEANRGRRLALAMAVVPTLSGWSASALGLPFDDRRLLESLVRELSMLRPEFRQLAERVRLNVEPRFMSRWVVEATRRLRIVVGPALSTARASVPSLIQDDFALSRVVDVHGIRFSHTELALLLAVSDLVATGTA